MLVAALAAGGLVLAGAIALGPLLAEATLVRMLRQAGFPAAEVTVQHIGLSGAQGSVRLDPRLGQRLGQVAVSYRLGELWRGRVAQVAVREAELRVRVDAEGGVALAGHAGGGGPVVPRAEGWRLPIGRLEIADSRLVLETPFGTARLPFALTVSPRADGGLVADLAVTGGAVDLPGAAVRALSGQAQLVRVPDRSWSASAALRAARLALPAGAALTGIDVRYEGTPQAHHLALAVEEGVAAGRARLALRPEAGGAAVGIEVSARVADWAALAALAGRHWPVAGGGTLSLDLSGPLPEAPAWPALDLEGRGALRLADGRYGDRVEAVSAALAGRLRLAEGAVELRSDLPWQVEGRPADGVLPAPFDAGLLHLTLTPPAEGPLRVRVGPGPTLALSAQATLAAAQDQAAVPPLVIAVRGATIDLDPAGPLRFAVSGLTATAPSVTRAGRTIALHQLALDLAGTAARAEGEIAFEAGFDGSAGAGVRLGGAQVTGAGHLAWDGDTLRFAPTGCLSVALDQLTAGRLELRHPARFCLHPVADAPLLQVAPDGRAQADFATGVTALALAVRRADGGRLAFGADLPAADVRVRRTPGAETAHVSADFRGGRLAGPVAGPGRELELAAMAGELRFDPAQTPPLRLNLARGVLSHRGDPPWVAPLRVRGAARGRLEGGLDFDMELSSDTGALVVDVAGRHDIGTGRGSARLHLHPLVLEPERLPVARISPWLAARVREAAGTLAARGRIGWDGGDLSGQGELLLEDVGLDLEWLRAEGVNTVLTADSLWPLSLPAEQAVAVALLDIGLPLTDGIIRFGLRPGLHLDLAQAEWHWAGGTVRAVPFAADLDRSGHQIVLEADGVELQRVLDLVALEGLSATGELRGRLPVRWGGGVVRLEDGVFESTGPGVLRYDPADPPDFLSGEPGSGTALLLAALANFHYDSLRMTITGTAGGEMAVGLTIRGANSDLYDGYPVALNLNVTGALDTILRQGLRAYRIPDIVRRRMEEFGRQGP